MAAPFLGRGGEFPCRIDPPCIESVVPSDAVDASADEEQRDGEQRQNREDERQPRALRQRVEVKVEMLALTTGPCADAAEGFLSCVRIFQSRLRSGHIAAERSDTLAKVGNTDYI